LLVQEGSVPAFPRLLLQRERNQVAKPTFGQRVLIRKKTVIRIQPDLRALLHRLGKKVRTQLARKTRRNSFFKEKPNVSAVARTRSFEDSGQFQPATGFKERPDVLLPACAIEVRRQKATGFVEKHGVNA
jgi:hypothetical protein